MAFYLIDRSENKIQPTIEDFVIVWDENYLEFDFHNILYLPFARKQIIAEQVRLPDYKKMDQKELNDKLSEYLENILSVEVSNNRALKRDSKLPNPLPVYINKYDNGLKRSTRTINSFAEGATIITDNHGNITNAIEYHNDREEGLILSFDTKGNLTERILKGENNTTMIIETWGFVYGLKYYIGCRESSKEEYLKHFREISLRVEDSTHLPKDVVRGVLEKYY